MDCRLCTCPVLGPWWQWHIFSMHLLLRLQPNEGLTLLAKPFSSMLGSSIARYSLLEGKIHLKSVVLRAISWEVTLDLFLSYWSLAKQWYVMFTAPLEKSIKCFSSRGIWNGYLQKHNAWNGPYRWALFFCIFLLKRTYKSAVSIPLTGMYFEWPALCYFGHRPHFLVVVTGTWLINQVKSYPKAYTLFPHLH